MNQGNKRDILDEMKKLYPKKFTGEDIVFSNIHRGNRIFIGTGCGEPRYLIKIPCRIYEKKSQGFF